MTMNSNLLFVLGASDPEMQAIEKLLIDGGVSYCYAVGADGQRVHTGNAYKSADTRWPDASGNGPAWGGITHLVECGAVPSACLRPDVVQVDHHRPGDPGYGKPPLKFLFASSAGQVISLLGIPEIPYDLVMCAAADHCLTAAYRGECPGVDPEEVMAWRIKTRSEFQRKSCKTCGGLGAIEIDYSPVDCPDCTESAILRKVESARSELRVADEIVLAPDTTARDMRGRKVAELPEASAREGLCFVSDGLRDPDGRAKVVCQSGSPEQIRAFMEFWAPAQGLVDIYGDPARGFAGGYTVH